MERTRNKEQKKENKRKTIKITTITIIAALIIITIAIKGTNYISRNEETTWKEETKENTKTEEGEKENTKEEVEPTIYLLRIMERNSTYIIMAIIGYVITKWLLWE